MKVAINIKTEDWNRIITGLVNDDWKMKSKYDGFDAGIDFDFLILTKGFKKITFGWDNWLEGEIKCSDKLFDELTKKFAIEFTYGEPNSLKPSVIALTRSQNFFLGIGKFLFDIFGKK